MLHVFYVIIFFHSSMLKLWFLISSILSLSLRVLSHLFSICLTWSDLVSPQFISSMLSMPFLVLFCLVSSLCFSSLVFSVRLFSSHAQCVVYCLIVSYIDLPYLVSSDLFYAQLVFSCFLLFCVISSLLLSSCFVYLFKYIISSHCMTPLLLHCLFAIHCDCYTSCHNFILFFYFSMLNVSFLLSCLVGLFLSCLTSLLDLSPLASSCLLYAQLLSSLLFSSLLFSSLLFSSLLFSSLLFLVLPLFFQYSSSPSSQCLSLSLLSFLLCLSPM